MTLFSKHSLILLILVLAILLGSFPLAAQDSTTLVWSLEGISDLNSLDPARATDAPDFTVASLLYAGLVRLDSRLRVVGDLAEFWLISPDGLTYEFILRSDAAFSDGTPITAEDVKWSLTHALDPSTGAWTGPFLLSSIAGADALIAGETDNLSGIVVLDDQTVQISINQPSAYFLSQLTFGPARITSKAAAEADPDGWQFNPVSSGAFALMSWDKGAGLALEPNPHYWQPAEQINELYVKFNPDSNDAYQQFVDGTTDILGSAQVPLPAQVVPEVTGTDNFRTTNGFNLRYVGFNNELAPFNDVRVRQAFALATNRDKLADETLNGTVYPARRILPVGVPGSELAIEGLDFDPAQANALLEDAGVDLSTMELTITYGVEGDNQKVVEALQAQWQENLGVTVNIEGLPLSDFSARLNETYQDPANGVQMYYSVWGSIYPDPQYFLSQILHSGVGNNNGHYANADFDALVDEADAITDDQARRFDLYNQAEQIAVTEVGWLPLFNSQVNVLVRECVQGVTVTGLYNAFVISDYSQLRGCAQ